MGADCVDWFDPTWRTEKTVKFGNSDSERGQMLPSSGLVLWSEAKCGWIWESDCYKLLVWSHKFYEADHKTYNQQ